MNKRGLHPDVLLAIHLSAIMSRNRYTRDPAPVVAELYDKAGDRLDILASEVGSWIGFYEHWTTAVLTAALRRLPLDMNEHIARGDERRRLPTHTTPAFLAPRA